MSVHDTDDVWEPIEGLPKQKRPGIGSKMAKKRADHRNTILKDWAESLEPKLEQKIPIDYKSPFDNDKCAYCLTSNIGKSGDEFRPVTQRGRYNIVNCIPCCGRCNSSKQDKCGNKLIEWIKEKNPKKRLPIKIEQQELIINWYKENEKYFLIPLDTLDSKKNKTYEERLNEIDDKLNRLYEEFLW
tara:strand:+ start:133 stop:690 length:558 start_codon:yes stop_codon:yes gene_type:complete